MKTEKIYMVQDDLLQDYNFNLQNFDRTAMDLTDLSGAVMNCQPVNVMTQKFSAALTVKDPATGGILTYTPQSGEIDTPGEFYIEVVLTFSSGSVLTFTNIILVVLPKIPHN